MPTDSEINQFRRYVGDFEVENVDEDVIESYLDDATRQATSSEGQFIEIDTFDLLPSRYKPEVVILAAINWWWDRAAKLQDHHSQTIGPSSQNVSEKWDRAMQMIDRLQTLYENTGVLGTEFSMGNMSRFSKRSLTRLGGAREEDILDAL